MAACLAGDGLLISALAAASVHVFVHVWGGGLNAEAIVDVATIPGMWKVNINFTQRWERSVLSRRLWS